MATRKKWNVSLEKGLPDNLKVVVKVCSIGVVTELIHIPSNTRLSIGEHDLKEIARMVEDVKAAQIMLEKS